MNWTNNKRFSFYKHFRLIQDNRKLNETICDSKSQTKPIQQVVREIQLARPKFYSVLDISSKYFSISYKDGVSLPTSFYAETSNVLSSQGKSLAGKYYFKRLPQGLKTSSSELFRVIEYVLRDVPNIKIYYDDILIFTSSKEEHFKTLELVLKRCARYGIKLSPPKCHLLQETVNFLGHKLSSDRIEPEYDKLEKIRNLQPPTTKVGLSSIIGFFNFFRDFLPNYYQSARLTALSRNDHKWNGGILPPEAMS